MTRGLTLTGRAVALSAGRAARIMDPAGSPCMRKITPVCVDSHPSHFSRI